MLELHKSYYIKKIWHLLDLFYQIVLIGDRGYIGTDFTNDLKNEKGIALLAFNVCMMGVKSLGFELKPLGQPGT